ncbi:MAG: bifunctional phosphoglucose/phosphomannose isomerase [Candidatus Saccharibacteria bacterium]|nr:bifunctional phosphoglucose/phosphomannose isomerase [Candidatus Saccharibacteria bacterium]
MLDDLKYIHERDAQDALGLAEKQWQQYKQNFGFTTSFPRPIHNVIVAGMGGSGLAAKAFKNWPGLVVPFEVVQDYTLPAYAAANTLVICSSYSGNTEEELAILDQALMQEKPAESRPMVVVIDSGGKLATVAKEHVLPTIQLPTGFQPRMTFGYQLRALVEVCESAGLLSGAASQLETAADWLKDQMTNWLPTVPVAKNPAKQLAQEVMGKSPVIYASTVFFPAAYKWKISFNENAKNLAWCNQYPEFNHNEFLGWTSHPTEKPYAVIELRSSIDNPRIQKRFSVSEQLLSGKRPAPEIVQLQGENFVQQMVWAIALGDFVSLYLALLNGLNPTPVEMIEKLKTMLG